MNSAIEFPFSIGDKVTAHGEPGWTVVGLCCSDRGILIMIENGEQTKITPVEAVEEI